MTLAAITGMPIIPVGHASRQWLASIAALTNQTMNAANMAVVMIGHLRWEDSGSHTIDTTGSSSIQWRSAGSTFANAGTTVKVGIGAVDASTGPPARAVNVSNVITMDVSASFTGGGGGITTTAWQTSVPTTGTKTVGNGDLIAVSVQMTARAGSDSVLVSCENMPLTCMQPTVTTFDGTFYNATLSVPNVVVVASDGTRGYIYGGYVASIGSSTQVWDNTQTIKEYGNILRFPFPARAYGILGGGSFAAATDLILYGTPLGTPSALATASVNAVQIATSSGVDDFKTMFASPVDLLANTDYGVIAKATSASSISMLYKSYNISAHQNSEPLGTDCYAINRNTGAFVAQNSNKDRFAIGLLVGAFDSGGGGSSPIGQFISAQRGTPY